jgi:hypothetical protein
MRSFVRELIIYQLVAVVLTLLVYPDSGFLKKLPVYLIVTNCIAWSIRSIFALGSLRVEFVRWPRLWQVAFGLPAVLAGCLVGVMIASELLRLLLHLDMRSSLLMATFRASLPAAIIVTILILSYHSVRDRLETQAVEKERLRRLQARAELAALQSRMDPHFLFNTLDTMANLVHKEPDKVEEMVVRLADIYRKVLKLPSNERISLAEEFDLAQQYLAIEQVRLGDRLRYEVLLPDGLKETRVPPLLLQPLVENAVVHGIMPVPRGGHLALTARSEGERIRIAIEDDGPGIDRPMDASGAAVENGNGAAGEPRSGFGLHSTRERLRLAYHGRAELLIGSLPEGGTRITLELPREH